MDEPDEFKRHGRKVVLLTMREARALHELCEHIATNANSDVERAKNVLARQVLWLAEHGEEP